jgi:hypothetical protein
MNTEIKTSIRFIAIAQLVKEKIMSRSNLYTLEKNGTITVYKVGKRAYVDKEEFEGIFKPNAVKK